MLNILYSTILILSLIPSFCQAEAPVVTTELGKIRGYHKNSFSNKIFSAFEGIPYAKPPNRFEESEPVEKWSGIWNANSLYECAQIDNITISGDEDCLYLNIYVPRAHINKSETLDVIVHIHGGGFMLGSGHSYTFPGYLMDRDVIFVTFNYRLGILGFLSTEDDVVPGNNGLKDQVLALKWVQKYIGSFGGNPNSVTLTGASAGGASVHLHYFSQMSRGLFQRGFSQSGSALNPWTVQGGALAKTQTLAAAVACPKKPNESLINCLKQRHFRQILQKYDLFYQFMEEPAVTFGPIVEKASKPFLAEQPYKLLMKKQVADLPWMSSFVQHEGKFFIRRYEKKINELNLVWNKWAASALYYSIKVPEGQWNTTAEKIKDFYLNENENFTADNFQKLIELTTDRMMVDGIFKSVDLQSKTTHSEVYLFDLSYTGDSKNTIEHAEDNQYFYYDSQTNKPTENDLKMKELLVNMLVEYAKTSKPKINGIDWMPVTANHFSFLNISGSDPENIKVETNRRKSIEDFWISLGLPENENIS